MDTGQAPSSGLLALPWILLMTLSYVTSEGQKSGSGETVGCFVCNSYNRSQPGCMDPYNATDGMYVSKCETGINGRVGTFPAHYCIKMNGVSVKDGIQLTVRTCAIKTFHDQCGLFEFDLEQYRGCLTSCDKNGCNHGNRTARTGWPSWVIYLFVLALVTTQCK